MPHLEVGALIDTNSEDTWYADVWLINTTQTFIIDLWGGGELEIEDMQEDYEVGEYSADELIEQAGATGGHVGLGV